jgi:hypothetical protein
VTDATVLMTAATLHIQSVESKLNAFRYM